jgi:hypothetical protein
MKVELSVHIKTSMTKHMNQTSSVLEKAIMDKMVKNTTNQGLDTDAMKSMIEKALAENNAK